MRGLGDKQSGDTWGWIGGVSVPVVGRVSMDLLTFDVTAAPAGAVHPGAWVDLVGGGAMTSYRPDVAKEVAKRHVDFSADQALLERCQVVYRRWTTV